MDWVDDDHCARGVHNTRLSTGRNTSPLGMSYEHHLRIPLSEFMCHLLGLIRRSVIDDQNLESRGEIREHVQQLRYGSCKPAFGIVDGDNDAECLRRLSHGLLRETRRSGRVSLLSVWCQDCSSAKPLRRIVPLVLSAPIVQSAGLVH